MGAIRDAVGCREVRGSGMFMGPMDGFGIDFVGS